MGLMLLALACFYAILGNTVDAIILILAFIPITAVDVVLELRSRHALQALGATLKQTTKVYRDGVIQDLAIEKIVPDDIILFEEGQTLPADGIVVESSQLLINESALTGESIPVEKQQENLFFSGTTIIQGRGLGKILKTGASTRYGKIAGLLESTSNEGSPLQKKINGLVKQIVLVAVGLAIALFLIEYFRSQQFLQSLIVAVTFGMAAVPEEFPLVFTLYLSLGAWRLSKSGVLVKSLPSVESLGSVDVICTDKTGTLTQGKFQLEELKAIDSSITQEHLWMYALMACEEKIVDSMELAIDSKGKQFRFLLDRWKLKWDYPFERQGKHMSHVWQTKEGSQAFIVMKGAVEGVLEHCDISKAAYDELMTTVNTLAGQGKRLLGLACQSLASSTGVRQQDEKNLNFIGLFVFSDPVRESAHESILACQAAGIQVKMLTGDHPLTAHAVADETGIVHSHEQLFTGDQLAKMSSDERRAAFQKGAVFSRVLPEQKYEMVQALKSAGYVVAMTGDGINDAPALKLADVGISMGSQATDVARSSAQIILLENDFKGIVQAIFEGRRIFSNLKRSFSYLISFHIPIILLTLLSPTLGWGDLLLPIHIVLLELIVHPISAFAFENLSGAKKINEKGLMTRARFFEAALSGVLISIGCLILFKYFKQIVSEDTARTIAILAIFIGNIFFVAVESWPLLKVRFWLTVTSLLILTALVMFVPAVAHLFHLGPVQQMQIVAALAVAVIAVAPSFILRIRSEKN